MSDKWVLTKLNQVAGAMTDNLDHFEMGLAAAKINSFIWDVYCDWFIEIAKPRLNSGDAEQADTCLLYTSCARTSIMFGSPLSFFLIV